MSDDLHIRVLIADDHAVVRSGLRMLLEAESDLQVIAEADTAADAVAKVNGETDVVLLDLTMPGGGGVDAIGHIRRRSPRTQILVLTMHDDPLYAQAALDAGAHGYILKKSADRDLIRAIRIVHGRSSYIDDSLADRVRRDRPASAPVRLSRRERQVLELITQGFTNREIGEHLGVSIKSVETYRARLRIKLGAQTRADLVRLATLRDLNPADQA